GKQTDLRAALRPLSRVPRLQLAGSVVVLQRSRHDHNLSTRPQPIESSGWDRPRAGRKHPACNSPSSGRSTSLSPSERDACPRPSLRWELPPPDGSPLTDAATPQPRLPALQRGSARRSHRRASLIESSSLAAYTKNGHLTPWVGMRTTRHPRSAYCGNARETVPKLCRLRDFFSTGGRRGLAH